MFRIQCYGGFNAVNITSRVRGVIGDQNVVCAHIGRYKNCINPFATELFFGFDGIKMCYFQLCVGYFVIIFLLF